MQTPLDKEDSTVLKGISSLFIIAHHFNGIETPFFYHICYSFGPIFVGMFFFLSAYGLIISYTKLGNKYLKKMLFNKIPRMYIFWVCVNLIYYFTFEFRNGIPLSLIRLFELTPSDYGEYNNTTWFMKKLLVVYCIFIVVFFVCSKLKSTKISAIILSILLFILFNVKGNFLYNTRALLCFCLGLLYGSYRKEINDYTNKHFIVLLPLSIILFILCSILNAEQQGALAACVMIVVILQKIKFKNPVSIFLGKISLSTFLIHSLFLRLFSEKILNFYLFFFISMICIIISATLLTIALHLFDKLAKIIKEKIQNLKVKKVASETKVE